MRWASLAQVAQPYGPWAATEANMQAAQCPVRFAPTDGFR